MCFIQRTHFFEKKTRNENENDEGVRSKGKTEKGKTREKRIHLLEGIFNTLLVFCFCY